ncbi:MAG: helix-turn-helix transcriptional regulator [Burkholderiales bacterium]|nr:helix-turn-helix transcriptional regulator [Burkholderiales bacterium]
MDINHHIATRIRALRDAQGLSLEALAERSKVSRSNISLIERGESSPTATVLDKLATALGVSLASLFEGGNEPDEPPSPVSRPADQPVWTDPGSGYVRRHLSPATPSPLQLVEVQFPPGQRVALETGSRDADLRQQIWLIEGVMEITTGETLWRLAAGDCLAMQLDCPTVFHNPGKRAARYLVALVTMPGTASRRKA